MYFTKPMYSYEERLRTFVNWPEEYKTEFVMKLAVIGQYSCDETNLSTCCVYCSRVFTNWATNEIPIIKHLSDKNGCLIFRLAYPAARRKFSLIDDPNEIFKDRLFENKIIRLKITNSKSIIICGVCGSKNIHHSCNSRFQRITENMDIENAQFYIKYLTGQFLKPLNLYLSSKILLSKEKKELLEYLIKINPSYSPFDTLESFLERGSSILFKELEAKMIKMEESALDSIFDDSIVVN